MNANEPRLEARLESWKEIGAYLQRDSTTARRWEKEEGLPVHRHTHKSRSSVYAYPSEIDAWRAGRKVVPEPVPTRPLWKIPGFALTMLLCLIMVGNGVRSASAAGPAKQVLRQVWTGSEVDGSGSVSFDGRYLSFTDWATGDLAIRDLRTGRSRRLTDKGPWEKSSDYAEASVISPDGTQIAYAWFIEKDSRYELRVLPIAGGKAPRTLLRSQTSHEYNQPIGWTPDGKRLLVERFAPEEELAMVSLENGSYRTLKSGPKIWFPKLSPDGRWVAYGGLQGQDSQAYDVYVLSTDGGQENVAVQHPANDVPEAWSPDGSRLYFVSTRTGSVSLWSIGISSGKGSGSPEIVRADTGNMYSMGMTRDGALYYGIRGNGTSNIYTAELGPGATVAKTPVLVNERFVNSAFGARLSPDGKSLAYYSVRSGPEHVIIVRSLESGKERDFRPKFLLAGGTPAWFPDGRALLIAEYDRQKEGNTRFFRLNLDSGQQELVLELSKSVGRSAFSPDGAAIFYTEAGGGTRLFRYDIQARRETEIHASRWINDVAISPDGKQLAFIEDEGSGNHLSVMLTTGGQSQEIPTGSGLYPDSLGWTPDRKFLMYAKPGSARNTPDSLWRVPVAGGSPEPTGLSQARHIQHPQMHPDGKQVLYTVNEPNANEIWALENFLPKAGLAK